MKKPRNLDSDVNGDMTTSTRSGRISILLLEENLLVEGKDEINLNIVKLKHPKTENPVLFLFDDENSEIRELSNYSEDYRCWFVGDSIESNGRLLMATKFDPLFLVIPFLKSAEKLVPLGDLIHDEDFPEFKRLLANEKLLKNINRIANPKGNPELNVWEWSEEKTLKYLAEKVEKVSKTLEAEKVDIRNSGESKNFRKTSKEVSIDKDEYVKYSWGLISEYLDESLSRKLRSFLKIPKEEEETSKPEKRQAEKEKEEKESHKKPKSSGDDEEPLEDYTKCKVDSIKTDLPKNARQRALAKSASGSKSITSFFKKK